MPNAQKMEELDRGGACMLAVIKPQLCGLHIFRSRWFGLFVFYWQFTDLGWDSPAVAAKYKWFQNRSEERSCAVGSVSSVLQYLDTGLFYATADTLDLAFSCWGYQFKRLRTKGQLSVASHLDGGFPWCFSPWCWTPTNLTSRYCSSRQLLCLSSLPGGRVGLSFAFRQRLTMKRCRFVQLWEAFLLNIIRSIEWHHLV